MKVQAAPIKEKMTTQLNLFGDCKKYSILEEKGGSGGK